MNLIKITLVAAFGLAFAAPHATAQEPARGQDRPKVERQKEQKTPPVRTPETTPERKGQERPGATPERKPQERPGATPERGADGKRPAGKDANGAKPSEKAMIQMALKEEAKHRERLAKSSRLRELAEKAGDREKLAKLDKLDATENARYARMIAKAKSMLGEAKFNEIHNKMQHGRDAQRPTDKPGQRPAGERPTDKPAERPAGERPTEKPAERPSGERPK